MTADGCGIADVNLPQHSIKWREKSGLAVDNGVTPRAVFMGIGPRLNRRVQAAFKVYEAELADAGPGDPDRVSFTPVTLETVVEAIAVAGAGELAQTLWARYCDFARIYQLSMQELIDTAASSAGSSSAGKTAAAFRLSPSNRRVGASSSFAPTSKSSKREAV